MHKMLVNFQATSVSSLASAIRKSYTNEWAVLIEGGTDQDAKLMANKYGYTYMGRVSLYLFEKYWIIHQVLKLDRSSPLLPIRV